MRKKILATDAMSERELISQMAADPQQPQQPPAAADSAAATPSESSSPEPSGDAPITLTTNQLQALISTQVSQALDQAMSNSREQLETVQAQLTAVQEERDNLNRVFSAIGNPSPMVNTRLSSSRDRLHGLAADFVEMCSSARAAYWYDKRAGKRILQRDMSDARSLFLREKQQLRRDMEQHAKANGLLQGGRTFTSQDTATVRADISPAFLDYLSLVMRESHRGRFVWWQMPWYEIEIGKGIGDTIQVPRQRYLPEPTSVADRTPGGTRLNTNRQNLSITAKSVQIEERSLGKAGVAGAEPLSVPQFLSAHSLINLEAAVLKALGHDYEAFEDLSIRTVAFASTRLIYNDRQGVTTSPGAVGAGDDGTLTENFANNAYAYASGLKIPAYDDGCYIWVVPDMGLSQLQNSLSSKQQILTVQQQQDLIELLFPATNREQGKVSGYAGSIRGFHFFSTNAHSSGASGTEGVQTEILGAGATLTRSSFILGQGAIARAMSMEAEIKRSKDDDFERFDDFVWRSYETTTSLDVDPAINAEEQLRVLEVRTVDIPL